jgi:hypothetical protein
LPVAVTALLSSVLAIVFGIAPAPKLLAPYADPVVFLLIGSSILAEAMNATQLNRRLALLLLGHDCDHLKPGEPHRLGDGSPVRRRTRHGQPHVRDRTRPRHRGDDDAPVSGIPSLWALTAVAIVTGVLLSRLRPTRPLRAW